MIATFAPDSHAVATEELSRLARGSQIASELAPGVLLLDLAEPFPALAERWRQQPPIFIRHICPADEHIPLHAADDDLAILRQAVAAGIAGLIEPGLTFSVQSRVFAAVPYKPFDLNNTLAEVIRDVSHAPLDVRAPQQIVSLAIGAAPATAPGPEPCALLGLSLAIRNLSNWAGGVRRFAREDGQISRSEFKLLEALELFQIDLPAHSVALDLGAAPGGWTRILRQRDLYVTAIDPAPLDPRLAGDRRVRYKPLTAQDYLQAEPDQFDLIVNDMRMDARDSARLMVAYARYLYRHGAALMTLKLPESGQRPVLDHALTILRQAYEIAGARQLFHNRSEVTVYLKRKA
jgi:23S rRNA (cytidine2498-2'-O)-methyltransferase